MSGKAPDIREPVEFSVVLEAERSAIATRRAPADPVTKRPVTGLALSGGGIRSAATCLGAIQALRSRKRLNSIDYLSTVSGGGYIGATLSAALSSAVDEYPFGDGIEDSVGVRHLRNYSNYLLPRSRSAIRNWAEASSILLRGLLANVICTLAFLIPAAILTAVAYPTAEKLARPNTIGILLNALTPGAWPSPPDWPFSGAIICGGLLGAVLVGWAMLRSIPALDRFTSDTASRLLSIAYVLLAASLGLVILDLQPLAILWLNSLKLSDSGGFFALLPAGLTAFAGTVAAFASSIGKFLETSKRSRSLGKLIARAMTQAMLLIAALILPAIVWLAYLALSGWAMPGTAIETAGWWHETRIRLLIIVSVPLWIIMWSVRSNGYSLHRLYRDRLSKAFLFSTREDDGENLYASRTMSAAAKRLDDLTPLDTIKLSELRHSAGPYPLINAALNLQGSQEANKRGRNADFFTFSPDFVGSDLTRYAHTSDMERVDSRIDLASALAISGAAASANMGGNTIRVLSPTLSLLNIRLGYYLKNPFYFGQARTLPNWVARQLGELADRFFLFIEMFNGLTERRRNVYLTDGGHIENLGVYALLKRGCRLIIAIDAEADPEMGFGSLLKLERYARIDLGVRISLPWEEIGRHSRAVSAANIDRAAPCKKGPHVAVGRVEFPGEPSGILIYIKSSLSGDEKDYVLDYAARHPAFPHETTGDQFFSEEQFEMYRALGFHMTDGLFNEDSICFMPEANGEFASREALRVLIDSLLPELPPRAFAN